MDPAAVLNIVVTANTKQATAALAAQDAQLKRTAATANASTAAIAKGVAKGAARLAGVGALIGGVAIKAAVDWEDAFADVRKTVETNEKGFARIEKGLRRMSTQTGTSAADLAHLAGEAGALGVKAKDIVKFTRVANDLGVTTDLSAEAASNALARLSNIMETKGTKAVERMGSTLVDLGNKGASTESEITAMALRIAGAGKTLGLTEAQVLGLSAALSNVGIRAEMGGSAISRAMLQMQDAVASGGETLRNFAEISDMSVGAFSRLFERDPTKAITVFTQGLDKINKQGGSLMDTLEGVELNEIRVRDTLLRLGGATGEVSKAQQIANEAWGKNNALAKEADKRYATTASQLKMLKARVTDVAISLGQELLPKFNDVLKQLGKGDLGGAIAAMGELGGKLGLELLKGLTQAFIEADLLGKLFIGGALLRIAGGKGAIVAAGAAIGRFLGIGVAAGAVSTAAGGAAAGAGGAATGGIAGGIASKLRGIKWARVGGVGLGLALATETFDEFGRQARMQSKDLFEQIEARTGPGGLIGKATDLFPDVDLGPLGKTFIPAEQAASKLKGELEGIQETGRQITTGEAHYLRQLGKQAGLTDEAQRGLRKFLNTARQVPDFSIKALEGFSTEKLQKALSKSENLTERTVSRLQDRLAGVQLGEKLVNSLDNTHGDWRAALQRFTKDFDDLPASAQQSALDTARKWGRQLEASGAIPEGATKKLVAKLRGHIETIDNTVNSVTGAAADKGGRNLDKLANRGTSALAELHQGAKRHGRGVEKAVTDSTGKAEKKGSGNFRGLARAADKYSTQEMRDLIRNNKNWVKVVLKGHDQYAAEANKQFKSLGVKETIWRISGAAEQGSAPGPVGAHRQLGGPVELALGGLAARVPGGANGDRHVLSIDGMPHALVEGTEGIFVGNSKLMQTMDRLNGMVPRFAGGGRLDERRWGLRQPWGDIDDRRRLARGGAIPGNLLFALGPETVGPIKADAGHSGTNSHVHVAWSSVPGAQAVARASRPMGWTASEAPWAGGVTVTHSDQGHYSGSSYDANTAADETHPELEAFARLLGGGGASGMAAGGGGWEDLKRLILQQKFAKGGKVKALGGVLMTQAGQAGLDKARDAINKFGQKKAGASTIHGGGSTSQNAALGHRMLVMTPGRFKDDAQTMSWGPWGESEWPPYNRLIMSESGWSTTIENPSSGAYGIPQSLPASKMATAGSKWRTDAATQIAWGLNYIRDVYGAPSNTPLGGYKRGGLIQKLANGGLVKLANGGKPEPIKDILAGITAGGPGGGGGAGQNVPPLRLPGGMPFASELAFRSAYIGAYGSRVDPFSVMAPMNAKIAMLANDASEWGLPVAMDSKITGLVERGEVMADKANMASVLGTYGGKTEAGWIGEPFGADTQLGVLLLLRNAYLDALPWLKRQTAVADAWLKDATKLLADYEEAVRVTELTIGKLEGKIRDIEERIIPAIDKAIEDEDTRYDKAVKKENKRWTDRQKKPAYKKKSSKGKAEEKKAHEKALQNLKQVHDSRRNRLRNARAGQTDRLADANMWLTFYEGRLEGQEAVTGILPDIVSGIEGKRDLLTSGVEGVGGELVTLHGPGREGLGKMSKLPKIGVLGGTFFDLQSQLREIAGEGAEARSIQDLIDFARAARLGGIPVFAKGVRNFAGGMALVGERGPELVGLPAGSDVYSNQQTQGMIGGGGVVYADIYIGGEKIAEHVRAELRSDKRATNLRQRAGVRG